MGKWPLNTAPQNKRGMIISPYPAGNQVQAIQGKNNEIKPGKYI